MRIVVAVVAFSFLPGGVATFAQQPSAKSAAAEKAEILNSEHWRRAMFELNEWLRTQTTLRPDEAARKRADFAARVETMSPDELRHVMADLDAKFQLLDTPEARETRAWFGQYLSVLADRRREQVLSEIPNFGTMSVAELNQVLARIDRKRSSQANFNQNRQARASAQKQANRNAKQAAADRRAARPAYRAPYRPQQQSFERPFDNAQVGSSRRMVVDPNGQIWTGWGF